jgi:type III pantothenate kinase
MPDRQWPLAAIDIGNTRVKFGLFIEQCSGRGLPVPARTLELPADPFEAERLNSWLSAAGVADAGACEWRIASVNRRPCERLVAWLKDCKVGPANTATGAKASGETTWGASYWLLKYSDLPLAVSLPEPERVGIDRLLGAVAVNRLRTPNRGAVVIDVGSAITVDLVAAAGAFLGGAILPGIGMSAKAMHKFTDLLPMIAIDELGESPESLGTSTVAAMRSGLYWGSIGAMKELIARLTESLTKDAANPEIFLTGGAAPLVAKYLDPDATYHPHLILGGMAIVDHP